MTAKMIYIEKPIVSEREVENDCSNTFCQSETLSDLQLDAFNMDSQSELDWMKKSAVRRSISGLSGLRHFAEQTNSCQIFCVSQKSSYDRLRITQELFQNLVTTYSVFPRIWDFISPFGFKTRKPDMGDAPFRFRQREHDFVGALGSFECAYSFHYAVLNHRVDPDCPGPDFDRWSIRQMAVYQQYDSNKNRIMLLLVTPSSKARRNLEDLVQSRLTTRKQLHAFDFHQALISTSHGNWRLYIRDLEKDLQTQSDRVTLSRVKVETDLMVPFLDRQRLKATEDKILDLKIVFDCLRNTVSHLIRQCQSNCLRMLCVDCRCLEMIEELEEQIGDIKMNIKRTEVLHTRAQATAQLISDVLAYENAQVINLNGVSLRELTQESKEENSKMRILTERSTRDAAAVKILTVITLIYLPVTVVASIFSSQLIQVDNRGRISVISEFWWFAVVSIPLTVLTFLLWRYWLSQTMRQSEQRSPTPVSRQSKEGEGHSLSPLRGGPLARLSRRLQGLRNQNGDVALQQLP
ncbi:hypothetical protein BKA65DRAFT_515468 [Rhexocercosporidium sp. MPI-PUGE-AT-0058]|nr:hypothetical protein BKA65DRAFT_515468 [Rhexocercosporidium sp. MPI-PUGE-AT-0058]